MLKLFKIRKRQELKGNQIEIEDSWTVYKLSNREDFFRTILEFVPDDSVWAIEGIMNKELFKFLLEFKTEDSQKVELGTIWPKQDTIKIKINSESRKAIIEKLPGINMDWEIIHQHIYKGDKFYLTSFYNLGERSTWISKEFQRSDFKTLIENDELELYDKNEDKKAT